MKNAKEVHVYAMLAPFSNSFHGRVKIGQSQNPIKRTVQVSDSSGDDYVLKGTSVGMPRSLAVMYEGFILEALTEEGYHHRAEFFSAKALPRALQFITEITADASNDDLFEQPQQLALGFNML